MLTYKLAHTLMSPPQVEIGSEGWSIWCGTTKLHSPNKDELYDRIYFPMIRQYWTTTHYLQPEPRLSEAGFDLVDWNATSALMKSLPLGRRRWCTKFGSENCAVGITLKAWKKQLDDSCPCCGAPEDTTHVLRCTAQRTEEIWSKSIATLVEFLDESYCWSQLREALVSRLSQWRANVPPVDQAHWSPALVTVLQSQDCVGWKNFMEGLALLFSLAPLHYSHPVLQWLSQVSQAVAHQANEDCQ